MKSASAILGWLFAGLVACGICAHAQTMQEDIVRIPVKVKDLYGREETMPVVLTIFRAATQPIDGSDKRLLIIINHGRAVSGKQGQQGRQRFGAAAQYFVSKGYAVVVPTRIGYWETYGSFDPEDSGTCNNRRIEPMSLAASEQIIAAATYAKTLPYIDATRWLAVGQSVGGLSTIATVARAPEGLVGGINFAGGTGGLIKVAPALALAAALSVDVSIFQGGHGAYVTHPRAFAARLASLAQGMSGVSVALLTQLEQLLVHDVLPLIPAEGSVGASGDLTPLSYVAAVLCGERDTQPVTHQVGKSTIIGDKRHDLLLGWGEAGPAGRRLGAAAADPERQGCHSRLRESNHQRCRHCHRHCPSKPARCAAHCWQRARKPPADTAGRGPCAGHRSRV